MKQPPTQKKQAATGGNVEWISPSNIAIVKYWGKQWKQLPMAPSLSMTLSNSFTKTAISWRPAKKKGAISFDFLFEGKPQPAFAEKIQKYLEELATERDFLKEIHLNIETSNSFPHSAGIASSASAMSALALCLLSIAQHFEKVALPEEEFLRQASYLARIGSGSACRSVYPGWVMWGETPAFHDASQQFATGIQNTVHPVFLTLQDSILIVDAQAKSVSSSQGHALMNHHPFREQRVIQAHQNIEILTRALAQGDLQSFIEVTEQEALTLHALMMSSKPGYILTQPNTLRIIEKIHAFRRNTGTPVCFTMDAGPNVHLLYPLREREKVMEWMHQELLELCPQNQWIDDSTGRGPRMLLNEKNL